MSNMREIAKKAGVSQATVSRVLSNHPSIKPETKQNVLYWVKKLNYELPKQNIITKKFNSNLIGVILPDLVNPFFTEILSAIESDSQYEGYSIIVACTNKNIEREKNIINEFKKLNVMGIITVPVSSNKSLNAYKSLNIPIISITKTLEGFNSLSISHFNAGKKVAKTIISLGFTEIGYVGQINNSVSKSKYDGFIQELKNEGINLCDTIEIPNVDSIESLLTFNSIKIYIEQNNIKSKIFFAHDDSTACDLIKALSEFGYNVPKDVAVIGFDNSILSKKSTPSITTLAQPLKEIGSKSVSILIGMINEEITSVSSYELDSKIIFRESTTKLKLIK